MSTQEPNRNSSQGKQESSKQGKSTHAKHSHGDGPRRPLPFDDDIGGDGAQQTTSNPGLPPPEQDF